MRDGIKLAIIIIVGAIGALIPFTGAIWLWSAAMAAIGTGANAVALKIIVSLLMFLCGFGLTVWLAVIFGGLGVILAAAILDK